MVAGLLKIEDCESSWNHIRCKLTAQISDDKIYKIKKMMANF